MTCIAGVVHDGEVFLGGDSAGVSGWDLTLRADSKIFRVGEFLMGFTTSFRMGQLIRYAFTPPKIEAGDDVFRYMAVDFIDAIRECLKKGGFAKKEKEAEEGGHFLVGFRGRLFWVASDYQVCESEDEYEAVGCGAAYAKGVLFGSSGQEPVARLNQALAAAERHSAGVRGPFRILGPESVASR
jgi:ATP-dependent protease HslVU (ClpYQ) peptidase subunit